MTQNIEEKIKEFENNFKCIESECDKRGNLPVRNSDGDWEAEQCQYCFEIRFPLIKLFRQSLEQIRLQTLQEVKEMLPKERITKYEINGIEGNFFVESGYNQALSEITALLDKKIKEVV